MKLDKIWLLLKMTYGLYYIIIGSDKFFELVTESQNRVSTLTLKLIPLTMQQLLAFVGIMEIILGLMILTLWTRLGAYLGFIFMMVIVVNLFAMGKHYDIAIHGTIIGIGMLALADLTSLVNRR